MKILLVHNYYQIPGGEDVVFAAERQLLLEHGHQVIEYTVHNDAVARMNRLKLAVNTIWSREHRRELAQLIAHEKPDVAHFHNTFMLISPAAYYACRAAGVPVVQTLHNYRLLCPVATFFRDGQPCEECLGKFVAWPAVRHACYRDSRAQTAGVTAMLAVHRGLGTFQRQVNHYIALTDFARDKFGEAGFPVERISVKPNFLVNDPQPGPGADQGQYMVFVGRIMAEKGVRTLIEAWQTLDIPLKVIGTGNLLDDLRQRASHLPHVEFLGQMPYAQTVEVLRGARALMFPSEWYEGLGMTILEAYACAVPVIASRMGTMLNTVQDGRTGLHFEPRDPADLAAKARQLWDDPALAATLGRQARQVFEAEYTAERNYDLLMDIYARATGD